jgi:tetratricopeptide (TPR) repeat protein
MVAAEQLAGLMPPKTRGLNPATSKTAEQQANVEEQPEAAGPLDALFAEYEHVQSQHLDMPSVLTQLSGFQQARGDSEAAEALLVSALEKNPQASASRVNLADLYRAQGKESAARAALETGIQLNDSDASLWFSLALLEVREGNGEVALAALEKAASLEETPSYYHYVFAVAQHDQGRPAEAMATLKAANRAAPGQPNVLAALMQYSQLAGDMQAARRYQAELRNTAQAAGVQ